jgi:hypothetical protein
MEYSFPSLRERNGPMIRPWKTMLALSLSLMTGVCFAAERPHIYTLAGTLPEPTIRP